MSTTEDVFQLYTREPNRVYHTCNICADPWNNKCICYLSQPIKASVIGDTEVPCSLTKKCFIKPNEECPICMNSISTYSTAYLTRCGHSFHKECIFKSMETCRINNNKLYCCPMCRTKLGLDVHEICVRYNVNSKSTYLDELENFWLKKDFYLPHMCRIGVSHYLGTNRECKECVTYRKTGEVFELF